jgi:hypothetical protein
MRHRILEVHVLIVCDLARQLRQYPWAWALTHRCFGDSALYSEHLYKGCGLLHSAHRYCASDIATGVGVGVVVPVDWPAPTAAKAKIGPADRVATVVVAVVVVAILWKTRTKRENTRGLVCLFISSGCLIWVELDPMRYNCSRDKEI